MSELRERTKQVDCWANQPSEVACVSVDLTCLGGLDTTCRHNARDITPLVTWRRGMEKEEAPDDLSRKNIINVANTGTVSNATLGKIMRDGVKGIVLISNVPS